MSLLIASDCEPQVLKPFHRAEAITVGKAAQVAGKTKRTVRTWAWTHGIGRKVGGQLAISRVALAMLLDGDSEALRKYHRGDRETPAVTRYFERLGVPIPRQLDRWEDTLSEATGGRHATR